MYWGGESVVLVLILFLVSRPFLLLLITCARIFVACLVFARIFGLATRIVRALSIPSLPRLWR